MSSSDPPSEVNENYPDFDYNRLQAPPEEWELYDIPDKTHLRNRALDLRTFKKLVKHHTWGFHVVIGERRTKERLLQVLKRIIFNQAPNLRPTWHEFISRNCDAGPRLLRRSYMALQISRHYPHGVPGESIYPQPQPAVPPQMGIPTGPRTGPYAHLPNQTQPLGQTGFPILPQVGPFPLASRPLDIFSASGRDQNQAFEPASDLRPPFPGFNPTHNTKFQGSNVGHAHNPVPHAERSLPSRNQALSEASFRSTREQIAFSTAAANEVTEAVERVVMSFPFRPLQRHPDAPQPSRPEPQVIATANTHLTLSVPNSESSVSHVRTAISGDIPQFRFDPNGTGYPYRGRGPVSRNDTTPVDCAIVVGRLLDAGSTNADRGDDTNWVYRLSNVERSFLDALNVNWDVLSDAESANRRDEFRVILTDWMSSRDLSMVPANVWSVCTESFRQFHIQYTEELHPCPCQRAAPTTSSHTANLLTPDFQDDDVGGTDLTDLLARFFQPTRWFACPQCGTIDSNRIERNFDDLPWRMAIRPDQRTMLQSHALRNLTVNYTDTNRTQQQATYRWLGGIYCVLIGSEYHFRVYWNDHGRGETDTGTIRAYDGTQISGAILGGLRPPKTSQRIPPTWWVGGTPPLLFYERVVNPDKETLRVARITVQDMAETANKGKLILKHHRGWAPSNPRAKRRGQNRSGQEQSDVRGSSGQGMTRTESYIPSPAMNLQAQPSQSPLVLRTPSDQPQLPYPQVVQRQSHVQDTAQQDLPYRLQSSHYSEAATPAGQQVQQGDSLDQSGFAANTPCPAPAPNRGAIGRQNTAPAQQANVGFPENVAAQPSTVPNPNLTNPDFLSGFRCEFGLPVLANVTTATYEPLPEIGNTDDMSFNQTGFESSTVTASQGIMGQGTTGTVFNEMPGISETSRNTGQTENQAQPWPTTFEGYLHDDDDDDGFYTTTRPVHSFSASARGHQPQESESSISTAPVHTSSQLQAHQNMPTINRETATAPAPADLDETCTWAFDFDAASAGFANPMPALTAPALESTAAPVITNPMSSNTLGDMFQRYVENPPELIAQPPGVADYQQGVPAGYYGEPTQSAVASGGNGRVKRKRGRGGEDGQDVQKKPKSG